jgi:cellulase/cellobiase CelA1
MTRDGATARSLVAKGPTMTDRHSGRTEQCRPAGRPTGAKQSSRARQPSRSAALFVAASCATAITTAAAILPGGPALAVEPAPITCTYHLNAWQGGFSADVSIFNAGPTITGWTMHWTFDTPTTITTVWTALMTENASGVYASNVSYNSVIRTGQTTSFGWNAIAPSTTVPTDLSINGQRC